MSDIDAWYCKVKPGGIIAGHDCEFLLHDGFKTVFNSYADEDMISVLHIGVCQAVAERFPGANHTETGSIWFYKKS